LDFQAVLGVGTLINLIVSLLAFSAMTQGALSLLGFALHFPPTPYRLFLLAALWRSADRGPIARAIATLWFCAMVLV
jgi:hypothetical protein